MWNQGLLPFFVLGEDEIPARKRVEMAAHGTVAFVGTIKTSSVGTWKLAMLYTAFSYIITDIEPS
jgi:hypothetical protein